VCVTRRDTRRPSSKIGPAHRGDPDRSTEIRIVRWGDSSGRLRLSHEESPRAWRAEGASNKDRLKLPLGMPRLISIVRERPLGRRDGDAGRRATNSADMYSFCRCPSLGISSENDSSKLRMGSSGQPVGDRGDLVDPLLQGAQRRIILQCQRAEDVLEVLQRHREHKVRPRGLKGREEYARDYRGIIVVLAYRGTDRITVVLGDRLLELVQVKRYRFLQQLRLLLLLLAEILLGAILKDD